MTVRPKKDVEQMNRFELLNEVERLRSKDRTDALEAEVSHLKHQVRRLQSEKERLERRLQAAGGHEGFAPRGPDRRREPQGRRKTQRRS